MSFIRIFTYILILSTAANVNAMRSDSFSITKTVIDLSIRNFSSKTIKGSAKHFVTFKVESNFIVLDLRQLVVDSIKMLNNKLVYNRNGEKLQITLDKIYQINDSCSFEVFYRGTPAADPGGWGGFYFSGDYAFNLGVGFSVNPHSFGRAWFPCVDEFTMKSAYEFFIETDSSYTAACNGVLLGVNSIGNAKIWHYLESVPMSAYLVAVSVSKYAILNSTYTGIQKQFPVDLYCKPADSNKVKTSFAKLPMAIEAFEKAFGPQIYSRVGYNMVPFSNGAMEHAGNITYPAAFANGGLDYEDLMAHELSHHWWGNNVTCSEEGDMWLNEGWASYCEHFFMEHVYGKDAYKKSILDNHVFVLRFAHINDGQIFSMINIPTTQTYGNHVYKKGADMVHSLRGVLGDSIFFAACKAYQLQYRLGNANSSMMENVFANNGGGNIARAFFNNWIYEKGFPHVIINKQTHSGNGPYTLKIQTYQNPRFTNKLYVNMPVEVFFFKDMNTYVKKTITIQNEIDSFEFTFDFKPVYVCLDYDEKISDAITDRTIRVSSASSNLLTETFSRVIVNTVNDTALIRVEHHWVGPEKFRMVSPYVSDYRYYTLDGIWKNGLDMDLELFYDGRAGGPNSGSGYLDHTLIYKTEDSLTVLYRAYPGDSWRVWPELDFTYGGKMDKQGKVLVKHAAKGEYVFAMYDKNLSLGSIIQNDSLFYVLYPNPAGNSVSLAFKSYESGIIEIFDANGSCISKFNRNIDKADMQIDTTSFASGMYWVRYSFGNQVQSSSLYILH